MVPRPRADAAERILRAAIRRIVASGAAALTMHEVSEEAGVSKGLIHYHFHDKETLLARMVEWMTRHLVARERAALAESIPRHAIDDLWKWLESELERGQIRVLLELAEWRGPLVQSAIRESAIARRDASEASIEPRFALLRLRPATPAPLPAAVLVGFSQRLAVENHSNTGISTRQCFPLVTPAFLRSDPFFSGLDKLAEELQGGEARRIPLGPSTIISRV